MKRSLLIAALLATVAAAPSFAARDLSSEAQLAAPLGEEATLAEADRLSTLLATYFGASPVKEQTIVVRPAGREYEMVIDSNRLLSEVFSSKEVVAQVAAEPSPVTAKITPLVDGRWSIRASLPSKVSIGATTDEGSLSYRQSYDGHRFEGLFDPQVGGFAFARYGYDNASVEERGGGFEGTITDAGQSLTLQLTPDAGNDQTVSGQVKHTAGRFSYSLKAAEASAPMVSVGFDGARSTTTVGSLPIKGVLDLWAFAMSHQDKASVMKDQASLKAKVLAILPLWSNVATSGSVSNLKIAMPFGDLAAAGIDTSISSAGASGAGSVSVGVNLSGIKLSSFLLPPALADFVPREATIFAEVAGLKVVDAARTAISLVNLESDEGLSDDQSKKIAEALNADGITLRILPSKITAAAMSFTLQGEMKVADDRPVGNLTLTCANCLSAIDRLQAAASSSPFLGDTVKALTQLVEIAERDPSGDLRWNYQFSPAGVSLNGKIVAPPVKL